MMKKKKKKMMLESSEALVQSEFGISKNGVFRVNSKTGNELNGHQLNSRKRKLLEDQVQHFNESEFCKEGQKRSKFECSTCNKIFHSYQALGGHRASHRKIKGCCASRIDHISTTENSIETEITNNKLIFKSIAAAAAAESDDSKADEVLSYNGVSKKSSKGNECPICLKVFPSGQALGGHKRSHLVSDQPKDDQTILIQKPPVHEIRDFLDLNLPAHDEDETNSVHHVGFNQPWWIGSSHKHEALVGFISN